MDLFESAAKLTGGRAKQYHCSNGIRDLVEKGVLFKTGKNRNARYWLE
jgi:hypothetical protein